MPTAVPVAVATEPQSLIPLGSYPTFTHSLSHRVYSTSAESTNVTATEGADQRHGCYYKDEKGSNSGGRYT